MTDMHDRIREDIGIKIRDLVQPMLEREINLARLVLPHDEVALLAVQVAAGVASGMVLVPVQFARSTNDRPAVYDLVLSELVDRLRDRRDDLLSELAKKEAAFHASARSAGARW